MGAGASARREYERRRERDRAARKKALPILAVGALVAAVVVYLLLEQWVPGLGWIGAGVIMMGAIAELLPRQSTEAWRVGAEGEAAVAATLGKIESDSIKVLNDRKIPGSSANIDHVVICPAGVLVVDAKKYKGELKVRRGTIFVNGRDRSKLIQGMDKQVAAVRSALGPGHLQSVSVTPVLCFVGTELPWGRTVVDGVRITGRRGLRKLAASDGPLSGHRVDEVVRALDRALPQA